MMDTILISGIVGGMAGALAVLFIGLFAPPRKCPGCGDPAPKVRTPANRRQLLWGGWTCPNCGTEVDRRGRRVED